MGTATPYSRPWGSAHGRLRPSSESHFPNPISETSCQAPEVRDIHSGVAERSRDRSIDSSNESLGKPRLARGLREDASHVCTISGHPPVNGVHLIENTCTYKRVFFIDGINRRSTTGSFFDSFFKFFRLVRRPGLKRSHLLDRKIGKEGERGSIAKRWARRTEKKC